MRRLQLKHAALVDQLKRLSSEVTSRIGRYPLVSKPPVRSPLLREITLAQQLDCMEKAESVLRNERVELREKLKVDASPAHILELESKARSALQRNAIAAREVRRRTQQLDRREIRAGRKPGRDAEVNRADAHLARRPASNSSCVGSRRRHSGLKKP